MKSNIEWKKWGEIDPLFGVAAWSDKQKNGRNPWEDKEFYALGKSDYANFQKQWEEYGVRKGICLEIGCGAGRITKHLAVDFKTVKALDISEGMITYARERITDSNVDFVLSNGNELPFPSHFIDAVFSTHVFQHFNCLKDASFQFYEIFRVLNYGGSLMIHLPIYRWPSHRNMYSVLYDCVKALSNIKANYYRFLIKRGKWRPLMSYLYFELDWLYQTLDAIGFTDVEIRIIRVTSNKAPHPFIFAKKQLPVRNTEIDVQ